MSIASAFSNALSGLNAASRAAGIVSSNVANALTEGYAPRHLVLASEQVGGGVRVAGVVRQTDQALIADRRLAEALQAAIGVEAGFFARMEAAIGTPDQGDSLSARLVALEGALVEAAARPEAETRLAAVLDAAQDLAGRIGAIAQQVQSARLAADKAIAVDIGRVNQGLSAIRDLNIVIATRTAAGQDANALIDQRQVLIDAISQVIPLREVTRENGQIALYSLSGATLLEARAAHLSFTPVAVMTADMTAESGALSGLRIDGREVAVSGEASLIAGGTLAAHFALRDVHAPALQAGIDDLARQLITRFAAADPSVAADAPGLFTDAGGVSGTAPGLAGRIGVSALADPARGGALWRLRDGLGAAAPGAVGNGAHLAALSGALSDSGLAGVSADVLSGVATARQAAEMRESHAAAKALAFRESELARGVDTDAEMQRLLLIEQAYAANARVIQALDDMIATLLRI